MKYTILQLRNLRYNYNLRITYKQKETIKEIYIYQMPRPYITYH